LVRVIFKKDNCHGAKIKKSPDVSGDLPYYL
jgi:hypothetical protein